MKKTQLPPFGFAPQDGFRLEDVGPDPSGSWTKTWSPRFFFGGTFVDFFGECIAYRKLTRQNRPKPTNTGHTRSLATAGRAGCRSYDSDHHAHPQARSIHCRCARNEGITRPSSLTWLENPHPH